MRIAQEASKLTAEEIDGVIGNLRKAMEEGTTHCTGDVFWDKSEADTGSSKCTTPEPGQWHQYWTFKIDGPLSGK